MRKPKKFNSMIIKLFLRNDFTQSISEAIENNQHFNSRLIEVIPTELGPEIWLKAKDENEIVSAAKKDIYWLKNRFSFFLLQKPVWRFWL
jgi:hypothetical protein